ncbi:transmembrane amino acid transporter [Nitzschia inconspicua]|uniref:Transmembrane amino acid transporter n=1 Tax=Nitzschia inconspicua TaxID=303405 RepID=A0A9K3L540_9STRA|nr:transmembrane amino acid transporter [Nitzschia inconspicua]
MTKLANLLLVLSLLFRFSATTAEFIPKKSWAVRGYEAFNSDRSKEVSQTKKAPPPSPPNKALSKKPRPSSDPPSGVTKAIWGVGIAAVVAAVGGKALNGDIKPERALVEALSKPIVTVYTQRKASPKILNPDGATIPNEIFNLVKAIVGVGVLSLPAGVAAFGSAPGAFIPAGILIALIGVLSGYGFQLIGKVCAYTGAKSYREAWSKTVGEGSSWIPAVSTTCKTFLACLAFSMVLADTFSSLLETPRNETLVGVTLLILLPLCLMKNLKSLAPFSLMGVMGMAYTAVAMTVRWIDGSYAMVGETHQGQFISQLPGYLRPKFGNLGMKSVFSPNALILVCMLSTAYMAHFNAPKFYLELRNNTLPRFNAVVGWSFGISIFLMGFITMVGFLTFGKACDGLVLNNYAGTDVWMGLSRIAVAVSLVFSYPLAFTGCRDGFLDLAKVSMEKRSSGLLNMVTIAILGVLTYLACSLTDVSFVLAFGGATLGNLLTYVYPALMYRAVVAQQNRKGEQLGVSVAMVSAVLGLGMGIIGAGMALRSLD